MKKLVFIIPVIMIVGILLSVYYENNPMPKDSSVSNNNQQILRVSSSAFENEGTIPAEFTCDGQDISPPS